jgi:hypothetical protein
MDKTMIRLKIMGICVATSIFIVVMLLMLVVLAWPHTF